MIVANRPDELVEILRTDFINCWIPIAQTTLAGNVASVTFASIPQNFRTLVLVILARSSVAATVDGAQLRANADVGANYDYVHVTGNNALATSATAVAATSAQVALIDAANSRASCFSGGIVFLPGYRYTTMEKTIYSLSGSEGTPTAATMFIRAYHAHWRAGALAAITSLTLFPLTGPNFVANSVFQLYGIL